MGSFSSRPRIGVPVVAPWLWATVALCVRESVCLLASGLLHRPLPLLGGV